MTAALRVDVDEERCASTGVCESIAADLFEIGDDGALVLLEPVVPPARRVDAERAVRSCPTGALRLLEGCADPSA